MKRSVLCIIGVMGLLLLYPGCQNPGAPELSRSGTGGRGTVWVVRPDVPESLAAWRRRIIWRIQGSMLGSENVARAASGGELRFSGRDLADRGAWLLCRPEILDGNGAWRDSGLPDLGWTSATGLPSVLGNGGLVPSLDTGCGLAARVLAELERAGLDWTGLNLVKLDTEIRKKALDTLSADFWRIYQGIVDHDLSVYDIVARPDLAVRLELPAGNWLDARGIPFSQDPVSKMASLNLSVGSHCLFRQDGGAWLLVNVRIGGDGEAHALAVEHGME